MANLRDQFDEMEEKGKVKAGNTEYKEHTTRKRIRSTRITRFEGPTEETHLPERERFRTNVFIPIVDYLTVALERRLSAYMSVCELFGFLFRITTLSSEEIRTSAARLVSTYPGMWKYYQQ